MTIKLYDHDSHASEFDAVVLSCEKCGDIYKTVLDQTLFFPEEGGQCSDRGMIDEIEIFHAELCGDIIYHHSHLPLEPGKAVHGKIDFNLRFRNMQNHSGEHIICGIAHKLFGYENVGFHLGEDVVTMDLDGELTDEQIQNIEFLANEAVIRNLPVTAEYPDKEQLKEMNYRSKGEIEGMVRIVSIGDVDSCACCAPHVSSTGEIGIIKIIDSMRHRGGIRLTIICGFDALKDYDARIGRISEISSLLSVPQNEVTTGVRKLLSDIAVLKGIISEKTKQIAKLLSDGVEFTNENICLFCEDFSAEHLRMVANDVKEKTPGYALVFSGNDSEGYKYVMAVKSGDVMPFVQKANAALSGRGGGRGNMASGSFEAKKSDIENYVKNS